MSNASPDNPEERFEAPEKLVTALRDLSGTRVFVPPNVDEAVLVQARRRLQAVARRQSRIVTLAPWMAAAASFVLLAWLAQTLIRSWTAVPPIIAHEDIDRNGHVDILDAFTLARQIETGKALNLDINGDGVVDRQDIDAVAAKAVRLEKGGGA